MRRSPTSRRQRNPPTLFLDENLSSDDIAEHVRAAPNWNVETHRAHLAPGAPDESVIDFCAAKGWVLVSKDDMMRRTTNLRARIEEQRLQAVMFSRAELTGVHYASALVVAQKKLLQILKARRGPVFIRVTPEGKAYVIDEKPIAQMTSQERTRAKFGKEAV